MKKEKKKHSKKFKIILTSIIVSLVAITTTLAGVWFGYNDPGLSRPTNYDNFYSTWMSNLKDDVKIRDIVMPGSHDAGTNGMIPQAKCQGHDIIEQLKGGVRYFDLRVTSKGSDLVIYHGPIKGQKFSKVINEFNTFIDENNSEFLILDFQHLGDGVNQNVIDMIKDNLPMSKMLPSNTYSAISDVDMNLLRTSNYNFMIVWKNSEEAKENNFYTRELALTSDYERSAHKKSDEALIKQFDTYYKDSSADKLFVLQAQRTAKTLLGKPSMYEKSFNSKVNKFIADLKNKPDYLAKTNIIMRDFVITFKENIELILGLNLAKNTVEATKVLTFKTYVK